METPSGGKAAKAPAVVVGVLRGLEDEQAKLMLGIIRGLEDDRAKLQAETAMLKALLASHSAVLKLCVEAFTSLAPGGDADAATRALALAWTASGEASNLPWLPIECRSKEILAGHPFLARWKDIFDEWQCAVAYYGQHGRCFIRVPLGYEAYADQGETMGAPEIRPLEWLPLP